jgi:tRNA(Arg) A34 adenosine deaminase TadA
MIAVREAAKKRGSRYLPGALLVTTLEPCPMCTSVAIWAKMAGIVFGATQQDAKAWSAEHPDDIYTWRQIDIPARAVVAAGEPTLELHEGVLRDECRSLFALTLHR